jgi:GNAT superfamily N-acetyltransferase
MAATDQVAARCALWWHETPPYEEQRLGLIGHYFARDSAAGMQLLAFACAQLAALGCTLAVGPMDGTTWQRYRFITERGTEPTFFMEPDNPDDWPGHFGACGFAPLAHYFSAVNTDLAVEDPRLPAIENGLAAQGIVLRTLDPRRFDEELHSIYELSTQSFAANRLYSPISELDFVAQYRAVQPHVRPELVHLAERNGELRGFFFCIPDLLEKQRGQDITTVIAKSLAVHPAEQGNGLGTLLMAHCHRAAHRLGYRRVIHALMHETNHSRKISDRSARMFRRYTLFARPLRSRP